MKTDPLNPNAFSRGRNASKADAGPVNQFAALNNAKETARHPELLNSSPVSHFPTAEISTPRELIAHELKDLYTAETQAAARTNTQYGITAL